MAVAAAVFLLGAGANPAAEAGDGRAGRLVRATQGADDGLRFEARSVYTFDPAAAAVHVSVDMTLTNQIPDRPTDAGVQQSYFDGVEVAILGAATNLVAVQGDGSPRTVTAEPTADPNLVFARVELQPNLFYGQSTRLRLSYDLVNSPDKLTKVNEAVVAFVALAIGDPGLTGVEIAIPRAFQTTVGGATDMARTERDGIVVYAADAIADPLQFSALVVGRNDERLVDRRVEVADETVELRGWPSDPAWLDFAADTVTRGLPALEELIGIPRQVSGTADDLEVVEALDPHGFAGSYATLDHVIEVDDSKDPHVLLHELSHLWFNDRLFTERWIREGLADEYAALAMAEVGGPPPRPDPVAAGAPGSVPLSAWAEPVLPQGIDPTREAYGYNTSWFVVRSITDDIGVEGWRAVLAAEDDGTIAYRGDGKPERGAGNTGWRSLLDQLEETGGSAGAVSLFSRWVADADGRAALAVRAAARSAYDRLEAAGGAWTPPFEVRREMDAWRFDAATEAMTSATGILGLRDRLEDIAAPLDLGAPDGLETAYEESDDLHEVTELGERSVEAAEALVGADAEVRADRGVFATIGLLGADPEGAFDDASEAYEAGEPDEAIEAAGRVRATIEGASSAGRRRSATGAAALLLAVGVAIAIRRRIGRRRGRTPAHLSSERDRPATPEPDPPPTIDAPKFP